jgi:hypothetical protein
MIRLSLRALDLINKFESKRSIPSREGKFNQQSLSLEGNAKRQRVFYWNLREHSTLNLTMSVGDFNQIGCLFEFTRTPIPNPSLEGRELLK